MEGSSRGTFHLSLLNGLLINRKKFEINHDKEIVLYIYSIYSFHFFKDEIATVLLTVSNSGKRRPVRNKQKQRNKKIICSYFFKLKKAKEKKTGVRVRGNIIYPLLQFFRM